MKYLYSVLGSLGGTFFLLSLLQIVPHISEIHLIYPDQAYGATTYYVATTGTDTNVGSLNAPFKTLQKAANIAAPGDTIYIRGGTYNQYTNFTKSGTATAAITYTAYQNEKVIFDGQQKNPCPSLGLFHIESNYQIFKGFELKNSCSHGSIEWNDATGSTVNNNIFDSLISHDNENTGIRLCGSYNEVKNSVSYNNIGTNPGNSDGIGICEAEPVGSPVPSNNILRNNVVYNNGDDGIDTWKSNNTLVEYNTSHHNGFLSNGNETGGDGNGFKLGSGTNAKAYFNVSYQNRARGFDDNAGSGITLYNNTAYQNGWVEYRMLGAQKLRNNIAFPATADELQFDAGTDDAFNNWNLHLPNCGFISTDPTHAAFLRLSSTSPCLNKGSNVNLPFTGIAPDLGAYEFTPTQTSNTTHIGRLYNVYNNEPNYAEYTPTEIKDKFHDLVFLRSYAMQDYPFDTAKISRVQVLKNAGFSGNLMQYIIADEIYGGPWPANSTDGHDIATAPFNDLAEQNTFCTQTQKDFDASTAGVTMGKGAFCQLHDSIVASKKLAAGQLTQGQADIYKFDHDLNATTPPIFATEDWFLHLSTGLRIVHFYNNGAAFLHNPGNKEFREYFASRVLRELVGGKEIDGTTHGATGMNGIFLDNISVNWGEVTKHAGSSGPKEFLNNKTAYQAAVVELVKETYTRLHSNGNNFPLWANLISSSTVGCQTVSSSTTCEWDRFAPYLDGAFYEPFTQNWGTGFANAHTLQNDLIRAEKWLQKDKYFFVWSRGGCKANTCTMTNQQLEKLSFAAYLLITDGKNASYGYNDYAKGDYIFYDLPEFAYTLGMPKGPKIGSNLNTSGIPTKYRREFECGLIELSVPNGLPATATITQTSNCIPAITSAPIQKLGDTNNDGRIDVQDYNTLVTQFNQNGTNLTADFNNSGKVDVQDYNILVSNFGK